MSVVGGENAYDTLNGWFKEVYASQEIRAVPEAAWITKNISFKKSDGGLGNLYHQPVVLTHEHGMSYAGPAAGAFALNNPVAAVLKDAQVQGTQMLLRSQIDYEAAARAANTKASFGDATGLLVENMMDSLSKRLEIMFLYGRGPTGIAVAASGSTSTFVVTAATWDPGLLCGLEGAAVSVLRPSGTYNAGTTTSGQTFLNVASTLAAQPDTSGITGNAALQKSARVVAVNFLTNTVTLSITVTGSTVLPFAVAAGDIMFLAGTIVNPALPGIGGTAATATYTEALGLDGMIESGVSSARTTMFNIDISAATGFNLYTPNKTTVSAGQPLTVTRILNALLPAIGKGLMDDVVLLVSNTAFQGLLNPTIDPVAQASSTSVKTGPMVTQSKGNQMVYGANSIKIIGYQGAVEIVPHLFCKDYDSFAFPKKSLMRVGATDITFNTPGSKGGEFFLQLPSNAGYELRAYANQGLFSPTLGRLTKIQLS